MIEMSEALITINEHMHEGRCPSAGCIGECAVMHEMSPGTWWAALYIWDKQFDDSTRVAKWFTDIGATDVLIRHVLHDTDNGDQDGECWDGARAWHVDFVMTAEAKPEITIHPAVAAIEFAISTSEGIEFLRAWQLGEYDTIKTEWPDCPAACFPAEVKKDGAPC